MCGTGWDICRDFKGTTGQDLTQKTTGAVVIKSRISALARALGSMRRHSRSGRQSGCIAPHNQRACRYKCYECECV